MKIAADLFLRLFNMKRAMTERGHGGLHMLKEVMIGHPDYKLTHVSYEFG